MKEHQKWEEEELGAEGVCEGRLLNNSFTVCNCGCGCSVHVKSKKNWTKECQQCSRKTTVSCIVYSAGGTLSI